MLVDAMVTGLDAVYAALQKPRKRHIDVIPLMHIPPEKEEAVFDEIIRQIELSVDGVICRVGGE